MFFLVIFFAMISRSVFHLEAWSPRVCPNVELYLCLIQRFIVITSHPEIDNKINLLLGKLAWSEGRRRNWTFESVQLETCLVQPSPCMQGIQKLFKSFVISPPAAQALFPPVLPRSSLEMHLW